MQKKSWKLDVKSSPLKSRVARGGDTGAIKATFPFVFMKHADL